MYGIFETVEVAVESLNIILNDKPMLTITAHNTVTKIKLIHSDQKDFIFCK